MRWHVVVSLLGCLLGAVLMGCSGSSGGGFAPPGAGADGGPGGGGDGGGEGGGNPFMDGRTGGGNDGDTDGGNNSSIATDCAAAASTECTKLDHCAHFILEVEFGDLATCTQRSALQCVNQFSAPGVTVSPSFSQACATAVASGLCRDLFDGTLPNACKPTPGQVASGAACGDAFQCSGNDCRKPAGSYCGTCTTLVQSGQSCATADCEPGLVCMPNKLCTPYQPLGGTCDVNHRCEYPLACHVGKCSNPLALGAVCVTATDECDHAQGLHCNSVSKKCAQIQLAAAGSQCGYAADGTLTACSAGADCKPAAAGAMTGTCLAAALEGAACDATNGPHCLAPAYCSSGKCALPDATACH
jgi:hypothetical protein